MNAMRAHASLMRGQGRVSAGDDRDRCEHHTRTQRDQV